MRILVVILLGIISTSTYGISLEALNNQAGIDVSMYQINYAETTHGEFLDGVKGSISGVQLAIRKQIKQFVFEPALSFHQGQLQYTGETTNSLVNSKLIKDTDNFLLNADLITSYLLPLNDKQAVLPYLHYGYRRWQREVPPVGYIILYGSPTHLGINSYSETYQNQYVILGLAFQQIVDDKIAIAFAAGAGYILRASLFTNTPTPLPMKTIGVTQGLGSKPIYELKATLDYEIKSHYHLILTANYTDFAYGKSKVKLYIYEPNSSTREVTAGIGFAFDLI